MGEELYINARVYVLALKLCMEELKLLAVRRVEALLAGFYSFSTLTVIGLRKMVEIVYPNTPDADGQSADEDPLIPSDIDPMRKLVAKYAASRLIELRKEKIFMDLVQGWREFSRDLLLHAKNGARVSGAEV